MLKKPLQGRLGDNILFEEINKDLNITFRYQWLTSREYGFIKRTELVNNSNEELNFKIIDGIQNILPSGLDVQTQQSLSNLSNAYKHSEIIKDTKLGIFSLGSLIMDRPDPGEALNANTVGFAATLILNQAYHCQTTQVKIFMMKCLQVFLVLISSTVR